MTIEEIKARLAELTAEHAALWRQVSLSNEWRKLQALEGAMAELNRMIAQVELQPSPPA